MAWSLHSMITFRALQGLCGGAFIPLAFSMVLTRLPPHRRPIGMALFAVTAPFAPPPPPRRLASPPPPPPPPPPPARAGGGWQRPRWGLISFFPPPPPRA